MMKRIFGWAMSLFMVVHSGGVSSVFAAESDASGSEASMPSVEMESAPQKKVPAGKPYLESNAAWKNRLDEVKSQRNALYVFGVGGAVAGAAIFASGYQDNMDVEDTPGCSRSGSTVTCKDQKSTDEAQDKLDKSFQKMIVGDVAMLAGGGLIVWGVLRGAKARRIAAEGKKMGYSFDIRPNKDGATLVLNRSF